MAFDSDDRLPARHNPLFGEHKNTPPHPHQAPKASHPTIGATHLLQSVPPTLRNHPKGPIPAP